MAKNAFQKLETILKDKKLQMSTKIRVLNCYVIPTLRYGSECWTISAAMVKRLEAVEIWFYRRMLKIPWTDHVSNEQVLEMAGNERTLMKRTRTGQALSSLDMLCAKVDWNTWL